jgi:protease I
LHEQFPFLVNLAQRLMFQPVRARLAERITGQPGLIHSISFRSSEMAQDLMGVRVALLLTDGVEEPEFIKPKEALQKAGADVTVISPRGGEIQAFQHHDKSKKYTADKSLEEVDPSQFDALLLPGGALNADALRAVPKAQQFAKAIDGSGKPIAVICHGPWLLVSSDIVRGRKITSYHTIQDDLRNAGAEWQDSEVLVDRNWVSSRKPDDIPAFNREMLKLFAQSATRNRKVA